MRNKKGIILGGINIFFGILNFIIPIILPVCSQLMKCHYMVRAEATLGFIVIFAGLLLAFSKNIEAIKVLLAILTLIGILLILIPEWLIGVCSGTTMPCNMGTKPAFILLGILIIITNMLGLFLSKKREHV